MFYCESQGPFDYFWKKFIPKNKMISFGQNVLAIREIGNK